MFLIIYLQSLKSAKCNLVGPYVIRLCFLHLLTSCILKLLFPRSVRVCRAYNRWEILALIIFSLLSWEV